MVRLQRVDEIPVAVIRRQVSRAELSRVVPECCGLVWTAVRSQGTKGGRHVAIFWDDAIRLEVGVELLGPFSEDGLVVCSAIPGGQVATVTHLGPYGGLGRAHREVHDWCRTNGYRPVGPSWEIYGHWEPAWNDDPTQIRTDVCYLVSPA